MLNASSDTVDFTNDKSNQISYLPDVAKATVLISILGNFNSDMKFQTHDVLNQLNTVLRKVDPSEIVYIHSTEGSLQAMQKALHYAKNYNWLEPSDGKYTLNMLVFALQAGCFNEWSPERVITCFNDQTELLIRKLVRAYALVLRDYYLLDSMTVHKVLYDFNRLFALKAVNELKAVFSVTSRHQICDTISYLVDDSITARNSVHQLIPCLKQVDASALGTFY